MQQHIYYIRYALQFADMQIPELVNTFNQQVQSRAWSSMRAYHDKALLNEFQRRGIDTSGSWGRFFWLFFKLSEMRMRQVIKHREIKLLKMTRRTDPVIPWTLSWKI